MDFVRGAPPNMLHAGTQENDLARSLRDNQELLLMTIIAAE